MSDDTSHSLGHRLRQRRRHLRIQQRDLAGAVGVSPGYLSELEHDVARAMPATLRRLALALALPEEALVEQATAEDRLGAKCGPRATRTVGPTITPPASVPSLSPLPIPQEEWVSADVAATVLRTSPSHLRRLLREGRIGPAKRVRPPSEKGPPRWLVATAALANVELPRAGYVSRTRSTEGMPSGYVSLADFAQRTGIPHATLHRRLAANEIISVRQGRRRWIPVSELRRILGDADRSP